MKEDITFPAVEDIVVAVSKDQNDSGEEEWFVFLVNLKPTEITNVLVASKGYGEQQGQRVKTSTLRHYLGAIPSNSFKKVEVIKEDLFGLANEYWVSFYIENTIYDKKYVFVAEAIKEGNFTTIPILGKPGVMLK